MAKKNKELLEDLNEKYNLGIENKADAEQNALININFINGKQYIRYNKRRNLIEEINFDNSAEYREKEVFNRLRSFRNTVITKIKDKIPEPQVVPYSQDDEDLDTARATNAMLKDLFNRQKLEKKLKIVAKDTVDIGPSFLHVKWNPKAGDILISDLDAILGDSAGLLSPKEKEDLRKKLDGNSKLRSGDVEIEVVKMFEIIVPDAYEQDIQEQAWMMRVKSYDKDVASGLFGVDFKESETVGRITHSDKMYSEKTAVLTDNLGIYNGREVQDQVVIKEYFEKPTTKYPNGRYIMFAQDKVIKSEDLPYINGECGTREYPFIKVYLDTPGLFYSHAFIEDMKSVQKRYNQVRNRKFEFITLNTHGQLVVEEGSVSDDTKITNKPGNIIYYKRGYSPPTTMKSSTTGTLDVDSEINSLEREFVSVTGISTLSTSATPSSSGIRGSNMTQMLLESDDSKFSLIVDSLMTAVIELSKQAIRLYKQFMLEGEVRFSRFTKDTTTVVNWKRDLLIEDIDIKNKAKLAMTDAKRKDQVQMLLQSGLLSAQTGIDPSLRIKLIEELDLGVAVNELPLEGYSDYKKSRRENRLIVNNGAQIEADVIDNHSIHAAIHTDFMKSDEYRRMVIANPLIDQLMRQHLSGHQEIINQQKQAAMAEMMAKENQGK